MEKIYSRKRLKLLKPKKSTRIKLAFLFIILGLLLFFIQLIVSVYPIFEETCRNKAETIGTEITSNEVNKIMANYDYNDLVYIERAENGEISLIKTKIVPINEIISETVSNIKAQIDNTPEVSIKINIGKTTGISMLSNIGPEFDVKMETAGRSDSQFIFGIYRKWNKSNIT